LARRREERTAERAFVVEGQVLVAAAVQAGADIAEVFVDEAGADRDQIEAILGSLPDTASVWSLPSGVLDRVGDAATSQGIVAVVRRRDASWPTAGEASFLVVLDDVADPGNAGTLLRAAAAAGADGAVVSGGVDVTNPKVVRASAGAIFTLPVVESSSGIEAVSRLRALGYRVVATSVREGEPYDQAELDGPIAVVLGNEAHGVAPEVLTAADATVTIPMAGPTESLNVAMAGTIVCFEVLRRRRNG
jgi:TrmH family RNA methyltransferase